MKDIFRFFIGLVVGIVSFALLIGILILLTPLVLGVALLGSAVFIIVGIVFIVAMALAFVWYASKKQPKHNKHIKYSIKQGREVK